MDLQESVTGLGVERMAELSAMRDELNQALERLDADIALLRERQSQRTRVARQLKHLDSLLESEAPPAPAAPARRTRVRRAELCDRVEEVLQASNGQPMHYREIIAGVQRRGLAPGWKNPGQSLPVSLAGDARFVRAGKRGHYGLRADFPDAPAIGESRRRSSDAELEAAEEQSESAAG